MILYNVTVNVENGVHADWLQWMKETHIPNVMNTGMFHENKILKLLSKLPEEEGTTYAIQYSCKSLEDLEHYQQNFAAQLQEDSQKKYGNKVIAFRTILEVI
ncbi:hypothetical protein Fleli_1106 [Bernardetia litoralis DSM 6794]|uniref:DUF4286 domain-containing protein n=1 Tax=Bernardetia litoralis (strain ATCC 23117 / DSM 6794 / NBRC 15988 / NCIMB 1366 / Fx l1 / Sio-4) TaxID=880071 RepID=I4AHV9_BERLS|nr:DUF4286 family protein [Bernardetia litoralis]AFM03544.1 hypothetical protein Fleli_1106 [Bernardetia litoralis DSM 6794]